jgi:hypothetical protein
MHGTWGRFTDHNEAEEMITRLGLRKGVYER